MFLYGILSILRGFWLTLHEVLLSASPRCLPDSLLRYAAVGPINSLVPMTARAEVYAERLQQPGLCLMLQMRSSLGIGRLSLNIEQP